MENNTPFFTRFVSKQEKDFAIMQTMRYPSDSDEDIFDVYNSSNGKTEEGN